MRFGDAENLLRKVQRSDGILQNSRSYVFVALVTGILVNCAQAVGYVVKMAVKKPTIGCCTSMIVGMHHRRVAQRTEPKRVDPGQSEQRAEPGTSKSDPADFVTEGKEQPHAEQTTMMTQSSSRTDFIAFRTVPIILKNGDRSLKVNALLDEASTKTYLNSDVAAELRLHSRTEKVEVNVLNGQIETFETKPVSFNLVSIDHNVNMTAYTANRVTGDMPVIHWNEYSSKWPYLRKIDFPVPAKKPIVDILIGLDCLELHSAIEEVRGRPGEPVARLTPLGWTCIGNPYTSETPRLETHFSCTYFIRGSSEIEELNSNLKRFWEIEEASPLNPPPIVQMQDQLALRKGENSIQYDGKMYRVGVPWVKNKPSLPGNYHMALQRLQNTEKRLQKSLTRYSTGVQ